VNPDVAAGLVLAAAGILSGLLALLAMRRFSDQQAIRVAKSRIRAHLYAIRLYSDDPVLTLRAQKKLLVWNARYAGLALKPALVIVIPALLVFAQLDALFGRRALRQGEAAVVTVQLKQNVDLRHLDAGLSATPAFNIDSPAVRLPGERQIAWRIRASGESDGTLRLTLPDGTFERPLHSGPGLRYVTSTCSSSTLDRIRFACGLPGDSVESIEVDYPSASVSIAGIEMHWAVWYALFWIVAMFAFRKRLGVVF
jgi:hypothetical protein